VKNRKIVGWGLIVVCAGIFVLWRSGVPRVNAQASVGTKPVLKGVAYPGEIRGFAGQNCPTGWLPADGREVKDSDHPALVGAIGDLWGSSAVGKFKLPDLRGVFVRGWNNNRSDGDPQAADRTVPQGAPIDPIRKGDQVGTYQEDQLKSHHHVTHATARWGDKYADTIGFGADNGQYPGGANTNLPTDDNGGLETRPKNVYVLFCVFD
jgi:microcystin-dependent protein